MPRTNALEHAFPNAAKGTVRVGLRFAPGSAFRIVFPLESAE
jgi:two-component sensor histidine kinase